MDPASILAIVGGVCMVVKGCIETYETWSSYCERRATLTVGNDIKHQEEKLSHELQSSPSKVQDQYNQLVTSLDSRFTRASDKAIQNDFNKILGKQQYLIKYLQGLRNQPSSFQSNPKVIHLIREYAKGIQADLTKAMRDFAQRSTSTTLIDKMLDKVHDQDTELDPARWPRKFCYGALLLQSDDDLGGSALACDPALFVLGFTCKYCGLEVGDYRMRSSRKTAVSTRLLAASHVVSCPSFMDRRAAYKCLPCHAKHFDIDFPSATALERHLKKHPNSMQLKDIEEKDLMDELHIDPKELGLQPDQEDVEKEACLPRFVDRAESTMYEPGVASPRKIGKSMPVDAVSIDSVDSTLAPVPASNAPWNAGSADFQHYPDSIPELDSGNQCHTPPLPSAKARGSPRPSSSRHPQTIPQPPDYHMPGLQPSINVPSRNHTPNPYQQGYPGPGHTDNATYQQHSQLQGQQNQPAPPVPGRPPPKQQSHQNNQSVGRASSESDQHNRTYSMGQKPVSTMNDISEGYHHKQPSGRHVPETDEKTGFFRRNKNKK
ncbi:hypothetical protein BKA65DRAFT_509488 [Rhexocercosporidium sp. MPI-PUGE-AT-0058]|nr:hypothetical protein BKA65DRAFT_509488 [Rhexocercosporidium sp. MPI-PUGE-AT-0058]